MESSMLYYEGSTVTDPVDEAVHRYRHVFKEGLDVLGVVHLLLVHGCMVSKCPEGQSQGNREVSCMMAD